MTEARETIPGLGVFKDLVCPAVPMDRARGGGSEVIFITLSYFRVHSFPKP